jgi:uncharacterized protein YciI
MTWIVLCEDKENTYEKRMSVIEEHRSYLSTNPIKTLLSGPLMDKNNNMMNGSFFMVEAETEEEIHEFQKNDPIYKAGVWKEIIISPFNKRVDNLSS